MNGHDVTYMLSSAKNA